MSAPVALITGVSSSVGKAIVRRLAFAGYKVAAAGQSADAVNEIVEDNKKVGGNVVGFAVDVGVKASRNELVSRVVQEMGALDSLVVVPPDNDIRGDIMDTDAKQFDRASVLSLTKAVAADAARSGVRVNAVCFGMVEKDGSGAFWDRPNSDEALQQLESMIPIGRLGRPTDAAFLVQFLVSPRAKYITGENCVLNGGVSFRL